MHNGFALVVLCLACSSGPSLDPDPTPSHPRMGCIPPTQSQRNQVAGKMLPETVRVIGVTSPEDGERWKVLRAGVFDPAKWVPMEKSAIRFGNCGSEFDALQSSSGRNR